MESKFVQEFFPELHEDLTLLDNVLLYGLNSCEIDCKVLKWNNEDRHITKFGKH